MKNKQLALLQISISSNEILSGALKRAKNASKLCTVFGKRRSENILVDFWSDFGSPCKMKNKQLELRQTFRSSILVFTNGFKMC